MEINDQLFTAQHIYLAAIDHIKDPEVETRWTHDAEYMRMLYPEPMRPLSQAQLKKKYEAIEKEQDQHNLFYFTIHDRQDERLLGFIRLFWVDWTNGNGNVQLGIGEPGDRRRGCGSEALHMLMTYAFSELKSAPFISDDRRIQSGGPEFIPESRFLRGSSPAAGSKSRRTALGCNPHGTSSR